jgi:hypothetical protein
MRQFEELDEYMPTEPTQKSWLSEPVIKLVTAVIALAAAVLSVFGHSQKAFWVVFSGGALVLLWVLVGALRKPVRGIIRWYSNRRYVSREYPKLKLMFERLGKFTSRDDGRSFRNQLYSASAYRHDVIDKILGNDYIEDWLASYALHLEFPCRSVTEFLARCRELTTIVSHYNKDYVIKTQKSLESAPPDILPDHILDKFEEFRERFSAYLNELEQWSESIARETEHRVLLAHFLQHVPHRSLDRSKAFKKSEPPLLVQNNRAAG